MNWIIKCYTKQIFRAKYHIYQTIVSLTQYANRLKDKLNVRVFNPNPYKFDDLTPTSTGDKDRVYTDTIKWALENKKILNIALTGCYGSGKSSILKTFEREHCEYQYLNISLASFKDDVENERLIELSILQQIFYHVKHNEIPDSRFKRIKSIRMGSICYKTVALIVWGLSIILLFKDTIISDTIAGKSIIEITKDIPVIVFAYFTLGLAIIISKTIRVLNNSKLNKLNFKSGEIELNKEIEQSILNKHIDEILYFFEVTKYNVVILEDLDRFKDTEIFTKLRELNLLINRSKQINRRVIFIYAIKDDKFQIENRTKFFDFIIPVISVINPSNAGIKFMEKLSNFNISSEFIEDISLYIDDMRLLKNICNEFVIYQNKIDSLNPDKLLAMIIYKNLNSSGFSEIQNNKGIIFEIFNNKWKLIDHEIEVINNEIQGLNTDIKNINETTLKNIDELRSLYILKYIEQHPNAEAIQLNNKKVTFSDIRKDDFFSIFKNQNKTSYYFTYYGSINLNENGIGFKDIDLLVDPAKNYNDREKLIKSRNENKSDELKSKIEDIKKQQMALKSMSLQQIANTVDISTAVEGLSEDSLLLYMLRNGYINEDYHDYISFFYEGIITKEDRKFIFSVKNRKALDFNYNLTKIENIIKKIRASEWQHEEILNFQLIDFLINHKGEYSNQIESVFSLFINESDVAIQFVDSYIESGNNINAFINYLCKKWEKIWKYVDTRSNFIVNKKDSYLKLIIENTDDHDFTIINIFGRIDIYITNKEDFIEVFKDESFTDKIESIIKKLNIKFSSLKYDEGSNWLTDFIYENNHYQINSTMIGFFLKIKLGEKSIIHDKINYTLIKESGCNTLIEYIDNNMNQFIEDVLLRDEGYGDEIEQYLLLLLNDEKKEISNENKISIIKKCNTQVSEIESVLDTSLWQPLFVSSKITPSWNNIISYYKFNNNEIDNSLVDYLNNKSNYRTLANNKLNSNSSEDSVFIKEFSQDIITCVDISDEGFMFLMKSIPYTYLSLQFENFSSIKVNLMVENKFLSLSKQNFIMLKANFSPIHIEFLENTPDKFIEMRDDFTLDNDDINRLLDSRKFSDNQKASIIISNSILIISDKNLCNKASSVISKLGNLKLNYKLLYSLIENSDTINNKLQLLNNHINELDRSKHSELISLLELLYPEVVQKGKEPSIDSNELTEFLLTHLVNINYISSFDVKNNKFKIFKRGNCIL